MSWYISSFFGFTLLNSLYFFKYSCTNIFHRLVVVVVLHVPGCPGGSPWRGGGGGGGGSWRFYFMVYPCFLWFILPQTLLILWLPFCWMLGWFFSAATFSLSQLSSLKRSSYDISIFFGFLVHSMNTCFWSSFWLPHSLHVRSSLNVVLRLVFYEEHATSGPDYRVTLLSTQFYRVFRSLFSLLVFFIFHPVSDFGFWYGFVFHFLIYVLFVESIQDFAQAFLLILRFSSESLYSAWISIVLSLQWLFLCVVSVLLSDGPFLLWIL